MFSELGVVDNNVAQRAEQMLERFPNLKARRHQRAGLLSGASDRCLRLHAT